MTRRRRVRVDQLFFDDLDGQLGGSRGPNGEPSSTDFLVMDLPSIVDRFAEDFDSLPAAFPGRLDYRALVVTGSLVASANRDRPADRRRHDRLDGYHRRPRVAEGGTPVSRSVRQSRSRLQVRLAAKVHTARRVIVRSVVPTIAVGVSAFMPLACGTVDNTAVGRSSPVMARQLDESYRSLGDGVARYVADVFGAESSQVVSTLLSPVERRDGAVPYETVGGNLVVSIDDAVDGSFDLPYFREGDLASRHCRVILGETRYAMRSVRYLLVTAYWDEAEDVQVLGIEPITATSAEDDFAMHADGESGLGQPIHSERVAEVRELGSMVTDFTELGERWEDAACDREIPTRAEDGGR